MNSNRLTFLLFLYVAADFANPLMPGAVRFLDGAVEAVHAERARFADVTPAAPAVASRERIEPVRLVGQSSRPTPIRPAVWLWLAPVRGTLLARPDPSPSSEDH